MTMLEAQEEAEAWAAVERERRETQDELARLRAQLNGANAMLDTLREAEREAHGEIARLKREVEHRLDEMNLQARWTREAQDKVARLRAALKPFAATADRNTSAPDAASVTVRLSDCRAALKALGEET